MNILELENTMINIKNSIHRFKIRFKLCVQNVQTHAQRGKKYNRKYRW